MDNRFGFKELVLCGLMVAIILTLVLAMRQYDRQWDELQRMRGIMAEQGQDLQAIRNLLRQGIRVQDGGNRQAAADSGSEVPADPFARILAAQQMQDYAAGDWYIQAFGVDVGKLTPLVSSDIYQSVIEGYVIESLAARDPQTLEWQPLLAESWDISEDGLTITFDLRRDVTFADGSPFTADDVVFTFEWIMNPQIAAPRLRAYYEKVQSVTKEHDYRVTFHMADTYFKAFDFCGGMGILSQAWYSQFSEREFNEIPGLLFGTGPYRLEGDPVQWRPGSGQITLVRNTRYWGVRPAFERVVFKEISDPTARLVSFRNGEIDRFAPEPEQYVTLKEDAQLQRDKELYEFETVTGGYRYVAWNQQRNGQATFFADKRVRQALTLLANRGEMSQRLMAGLATPASGPFHHSSPQSNPDIQPWPHDFDQAMALLKEAGFEDRNGDGTLESSDGQPFVFRLIYPAQSTNYQQMAFYLKDAYARAGIVLEPDPLEWTIMIQRISQRDFDAMTLGWSGGIESDVYQMFHSSQVADGGDNYVHYVNEQLDSLLEQARITMDEDQRMALWHQAHAILHEDQPYTFLWTTRAVIFLDKRIANVQRTRLGLNPDVEWFVPLDQQRWGR